MSKNQLKKLRRKQNWEDKRDDRKRKRKEKRQEQKKKRRADNEEKRAEAIAAGVDPSTLLPKKPPRSVVSTNVPIALIIDCDFETYMRENEIVSLSSQITRCYSDNRQAAYRTHLYVSSWGGQLRERFRTVMEDVQHSWKGVHFVEGSLIDAAKEATELMQSDQGGELIDRIQPSKAPTEPVVKDADVNPAAEPVEEEPQVMHQNIVYLSSDSPHTLERLEANTCYVIGGLVDRNREKGLCYKRAVELGVRTARLPIDQYMVMQSRKVLTTNHVVDIIVRWLEGGDWGAAFASAIPKRKGGQLRDAVEPSESRAASAQPAADLPVTPDRPIKLGLDGAASSDEEEPEDAEEKAQRRKDLAAASLRF